VAGVASGIARYFGIDVAWVRIGFVVLALFGGSGVLLYLIGWLAIPEEGVHESIAADKAGDLQGAGSWIGIGLIVVAGMIVLGNTGIIRGELLFAAMLVGAGILLYRGDIGLPAKRERMTIDSSAPAPEVSESGADETGAGVSAGIVDHDTWRAEEPSYPVAPPVPPPPPDPAFQPRPRTPRETSYLGRFALATALIFVGVMGVGHSAGWFEPTLRHYSAAILVVFGGALLISSFFGRARWLIVVGLVMAPLLIAMALLKVPFEGGFGDVRYTPTNVAEVNAEYRLIAGQMVLDLTELDLTPGEEVVVEASVVFGRLEIIAPADVGLDAVVKVDAGEIFLDGERGSRMGRPDSDNINVERSVFHEGESTIRLEAHVGFGELVIDRVAEVTQ
jgi:phage shock protein PspC (stress-responsive transcriptional regulator)/predicted membrane protein